ncbi:hypothetical protein F4820DRAFT_256826 [Hypoxylon rubiginosum]|uniref:Uncharacterized protein n=1 Tax=Hypoxylon rubiginosum TaxID=110542 RepID=A0ACB9ZG10_9PEZI|nr:hypothetical protein F4820DRAFT_256826 [Hypoxylon rubiginosum]
MYEYGTKKEKNSHAARLFLSIIFRVSHSNDFLPPSPRSSPSPAFELGLRAATVMPKTTLTYTAIACTYLEQTSTLGMVYHRLFIVCMYALVLCIYQFYQMSIKSLLHFRCVCYSAPLFPVIVNVGSSHFFCYLSASLTFR